MKEYVPYLIPTTKVLNLLLRCYSNFSGPPRRVEVGGEGGDTEEDKSVGYPERALSLLRDMVSIRYQAKAKKTMAEADDEGGGGR